MDAKGLTFTTYHGEMIHAHPVWCRQGEEADVNPQLAAVPVLQNKNYALSNSF